MAGRRGGYLKRALLRFPGRSARFHVKAMPCFPRNVRIIRVKLDEFIVTNESRVICRGCQR